jgi:hypothetical protein
MKKIFYILLLYLNFSANAQDSIIKRDGSELKVKITEISETELKYKKSGLSVLFSLGLDEVLLVTFENGERMIFENAEADASSNSKLITAGTRIPLIMNETISSDEKGGRKVYRGELIALTVESDVTDVDGNILVQKGTLVNGTITKSEKRKSAGTKGKLAFSVNVVKSIDGQSVQVDLKFDIDGESKTATAVVAAVLVAAPLLLIKGKPAVINSGTVFYASVVEDKKITSNIKSTVVENNESSFNNLNHKNDVDFISKSKERGVYFKGNNCPIHEEISAKIVIIKCLNESGRAYDTYAVKKSELTFHGIAHEWQITDDSTIEESKNPKSDSPGLYFNGSPCKIIGEMPDGYVKIKYLTDTGRGYYRVIILRNDIVEIK